MRPLEAVDHPYSLETPHGSLSGIEQRDRSGTPVLRRFLKIPYAMPPVGNLRWRRPQKLSSDFSFNSLSGSPGDYTQFGPICPQPIYDLSPAHLPNPNAAPHIENVHDEDCLYLNIWVPAASPPEGGWPVQFHLHGGWLQVGNASQNHDTDPFQLLTLDDPRIIVVPTYRLNLFGFLAGEDLSSIGEDPAAGNYGFWDQRCALEWTAKYISYFGGNPANITVGGLSAGANSTFYQLYYDALLPESQRLIQRIYLWSNAVLIQPSETTSPALSGQFNELCAKFEIPETNSPEDKLSKLRHIPFKDLVEVIPKLKMHTFRASTDDDFIPKTFLASLHSGAYTTRLHDNGTYVLLGEVSDEGELYKITNTPYSMEGLELQLDNYYPKEVCNAMLALYPVPEPGSAEDKPETYADLFGQIVADGQVHAAHRGFAHLLLNPPQSSGVRALSPQSVFRYRISWRAKALDAWLKPELGVFHAADTQIWWASGWRQDFTEEDKAVTKEFLKPFGRYFYGDKIEWASSPREDNLRWLDQNGRIHMNYQDPLWGRKLEVWDAVWAAQKNLVTLE